MPRPLTLWFHSDQLDRIEAKLDLVLRLERKIMADEQALDDALAELSTAVDGIVAKVSESGIDLTDELDTVQGITQKIQDALAAPAPAEPPAEPV